MDRGGASVEAFLGAITRWRDEVRALCSLLEAEGLEGTIKWGAPCYVTRGGNVALVQRMKDYCALAFPRGALLEDAAGILTQPGNHRSLRQIRLRSVAEIEAQAPLIRNYIRRARVLTEEGRRIAPRPEGDVAMPEELSQALDADPALAEAFAAMTPGRRRAWLLHIGAAARPATREARILRGRDDVLARRGPGGR